MIDVELTIGVDWGNSGFGQNEIEKAVDAAVKFAGLPGLADYPSPVSVSINCRIMTRFMPSTANGARRTSRPMSLSFPMLDDDELQNFRHPAKAGAHHPVERLLQVREMDSRLRGNDEQMELMLGDIILAHGICQAEAEEKAIPPWPPRHASGHSRNAPSARL